MTLENRNVTDRLARIYALHDPPWAVALAGFIAKSYYTEFGMPAPVRAAFDLLNAKLVHWWPRLAPPLGDIYSVEYARCQTYFNVETDKERLKLETSLLKTSLVQMRVLSFIEGQLDESRPGIGNDICEISAQSLAMLVSEYMSAVSTDRQAFLNQWIDAFAGGTVVDWETGLSGLFSPIGGPPKKSN
jgi:hypothetical protein